MKNLLLSFFLLSAATFLYPAFGQGNLQFNQTRLITFESPSILITPSTPSYGGHFYDSLSFVVPVGKTIKIEGINGGSVYDTYTLNQNATFNNIPLGGNFYISINDILVATLSGGSPDKPQFPIWLPAGDYEVKIFGSSISHVSTQKIKVMISALEFNIIP